MASGNNSPRAVSEKPQVYENFVGLETVRDDTSQDLGQNQPLSVLNNGFIDPLGQIIRDPGLDRIQSGSNVVAARHLDLTDITWVQRTGSSYSLNSSNGINFLTNWEATAIPSYAGFSTKLYLFSQGERPVVYDGYAANLIDGPLNTRLRPAFGATVQSRFVVAGMPQYPGIIEISRTNDLNFFSEEEPADSESVLRGGKIDIQNILGSREPITGLHPFETNKLLIFTGTRGILYNVSTDIDQWAIEDRTAISSGCISHNTIQTAGSDVMFCSRTGVHSVLRSRQNGVMVYSMPMSSAITLLYRSLVRQVSDPRRISAVWDADEAQYHIFFPIDSGPVRLTMTLDPGSNEARPHWSLAEGFIPGSCGDFYQGSLIYGSPDGIFQVGKIEEESREYNPELTVATPTLYLGSFTDAKTITGMAIAAYGRSTLTIELIDPTTNAVIFSKEVRVLDTYPEGAFDGTPLSKRRRIPINLRTTQFKLRVTAKGVGLFRLAGFAFFVGRD